MYIKSLDSSVYFNRVFALLFFADVCSMQCKMCSRIAWTAWFSKRMVVYKNENKMHWQRRLQVRFFDLDDLLPHMCVGESWFWFFLPPFRFSIYFLFVVVAPIPHVTNRRKITGWYDKNEKQKISMFLCVFRSAKEKAHKKFFIKLWKW